MASVREDSGHVNSFLGEVRTSGWWYFYPVTLFFKTPISFVTLTAVGLVYLICHANALSSHHPLLASILGVAAVVQTGMFSNLNNGTRQILAIYPLASILAAFGALRLWRLSGGTLRWQSISCGLMTWQIVASITAHGDYIAYFNELAGPRPETITVDSDLDWGQDLKRLVSELKQQHIDTVAIAYYGSADLAHFELPTWKPLEPNERTTGWIAISIGCLKMGTLTSPFDQYVWLEEFTPIKRIGTSMLLYHIQSVPPD